MIGVPLNRHQMSLVRYSALAVLPFLSRMFFFPWLSGGTAYGNNDGRPTMHHLTDIGQLVQRKHFKPTDWPSAFLGI